MSEKCVVTPNFLLDFNKPCLDLPFSSTAINHAKIPLN